MKILIISQHFWPETFRINDLTNELVKRGHDVSVLTGIPNYPKGKFYEGYSIFSPLREEYNGAKIYRVPIIPRGKADKVHLILNYLSFVISSCVFILFSRRKFDVSLTFASSPITQVYAGIFDKILHKSRAYLWIQDLWPESVTAAGKVNSKFVLRLLDRMVRRIYKSVDKILVQSEAFIPSIIEKGTLESKVEYIPNWAEDLYLKEYVEVPEYVRTKMPDGFNIVFAGNIGEAQDFDSIIKAALLTKDIKNIHWVIIGDGRKKSWVESEVKSRQLERTVHLLGRYPVEDMPYFFQMADIMLLSLKDEPIFSLTIPSKLQSYMAAKKPILGMINGIAKKIILETGCGFVGLSGDAEKLASNAIIAYSTSTSDLKEMGEKGYNYYRREFDKDKVITKLVNIR